MPFVIDQQAIASMSTSHVVDTAIAQGVDLVKMWPLQTVEELENDARYAEDLQVRFSQMMAQVLLKGSEEVDQSVAEATYEGMDMIPGCDPEVLDALANADDAYDMISSYRGINGADLFLKAAKVLGIEVGGRVEDGIRDVMDSFARSMHDTSGLDINAEIASNIGLCKPATTKHGELATRYLTSLAVSDALMNLMCYGVNERREQAIRVLPVLLIANGIREQLAVPHTFITAQQVYYLVALRDSARRINTCEPVLDNPFCTKTFLATVKYLAMFAGQEWAWHAERVQWDLRQAEQEARDEDNRRSREELAKKYKLTEDSPAPDAPTSDAPTSDSPTPDAPTSDAPEQEPRD